MQVSGVSTDLAELERALGHVFQNKALLVRSLTHSSSANEGSCDGARDNERLEFLGDSVLGWLVSEWLFNRFPISPKGSSAF